MSDDGVDIEIYGDMALKMYEEFVAFVREQNIPEHSEASVDAATWRRALERMAKLNNEHEHPR